jgi:hypothetical protein
LAGSIDELVVYHRIFLGKIVIKTNNGVDDEKTEEGHNEEEEHRNIDDTSEGKDTAVESVVIRIIKGIVFIWLVKGWVIDVGHESTTCIQSTRRVLAVV